MSSVLELSSGSVHSFHAPTPDVAPHFRIAAFRAAFSFQSRLPAADRDRTSRLTLRDSGQRRTFPAHALGGVRGSTPVCLVRPAYQQHAQAGTLPPPGPLSRVTTSA